VASAEVAFASPAHYPPYLLPQFYGTVLEAWSLLCGHRVRHLGLVLQRSADRPSCLAEGATTKDFYRSLVDVLGQPPHCIVKFQPCYGDQYWPLTWAQVSNVPFDRKVRDFSWKVSHGVVYTADRLVGFGMQVDSNCFFGQAPETPEHLFFNVVLFLPFFYGLRRCFCASLHGLLPSG
jgi:hypothetical protein